MSEPTTQTLSAGTSTKPLNRNALKYLVIVAMLIDHLAWGFVDAINPTLGAIMHFIGRLTGPTMAFFLAEGYKHTSNPGRYQLRLGIFALISWIPYVFFETGRGFIQHPGNLIVQSVIYTLFLGITAIRVYDSKLPDAAKVILILMLTCVSVIGDWPVMDVLAPLFMYIFRDNKKARYISVSLVYGLFMMLAFLSPATNENGVPSGIKFDIAGNWFQLGIILVPIIIILFYNGNGGKKSAFNKWFFYIFYPAHLMILGFIKLWINK